MAKWKTPRKCLRLENLEDRAVPSGVPAGDQDPAPPPAAAGGMFTEDDHDHGPGDDIFLPPQFYLADLEGGFLTGPTAGEPLAIARAYLTTRAADLGLTPGDVADLAVITDYVTETTGVTHLGFQQTLNGLPVRNTNFSVNVTADGRIINVGGYAVRDVGRFTGQSIEPALAAADALRAAAAALGLPADGEVSIVEPETGPNRKQTLAAPGISATDVPMFLEYAASPDGGVELAWNMIVETPDRAHWYNLSGSATDGELLLTQDYIHHAGYNVYPVPVESPSHGSRSIQTDPHLLSPVPGVVPSPFGWHDTNGVSGAEFTITRGNNVSAYTDTDNNNSPDTGSQPDGGAGLVFDFPVDLTQAPSTYRPAAVTNLFYWNNFLHDVHYLYGFTEAARNFQTNNYGRGGAGNDEVQAEAQDGGGLNNANFGTPPDGSRPRMQMYLWNTASPTRDGDFDNGIIVHEYGHGVSNRLTNNANGLSAVQSSGMGEGWSDFWAMMLTQKTAAETTAGRGMGTYALNQPVTGQGIRAYRYDYDITNQNLETFLAYGIGPGQSTAVHWSGTRWASALWDINHLLIQKYGYNPNVFDSTSPAGNIVTLHLIMNGLKLQPSNPSFLQARDAILQADQVLYGGANNAEIWQAFARRGLGFSATTPGATSSFVAAAFDLPAAPGVTINQAGGQADPTGGSAINYTAVFSRAVTGFDGSDISFAGSTVGGSLQATVSGSGTTYTVTVTGMSGEGNVVVTIPAGAAQDAFGGKSKASTSSDNTVRFDGVGASVTINQGAGQPDPTSVGPVVFDVVFSEAVTGFDGSDVSFAGSTVGGSLQASVSGSGTTYTVSVTGMSGLGTVVASIPAGAALDSLGNSNSASTSTDNTVSVDTAGKVQFELTDFIASEKGGTVPITATRTGGAADAVSVQYSTGGGSATAGQDYQSTTGTLSWKAGESGARTFVITLLDDSLVEGDETVGLTLSNPTGGLIIGTPDMATLKIEDVEEGLIQFASAVVSAGEDDGFVTISATRTAGAAGPVSVDFATIEDSARAWTDYAVKTGTLSWADGEAGTKTFEVLLLPDEANEGRENIRLTLSNPTSGARIGLGDSLLWIAPSDPKGNGKFLDQDGDIGKVLLSGPGRIGFYLTDPDGDGKGPIELIELADTDSRKSVLTLTTRKMPDSGDGGRVNLGAVTGSGLLALYARTYNLDGDGINLSGHVGTVALGHVMNGSDITAGGTSIQKTRIKAGVVGDGTTIDVGSSLAGLTVTKFGVGTITAPTIGVITARGDRWKGVAGDFGADVTVSGDGVLAGRPALRAIRVAGELFAGTDVEVAGTVGVVRAGTFNGSLTAGGVGTMLVREKMGGDVTLSGTGVVAGRPALGALTVGWQIAPEAAVNAPSVGTLIVRGIMKGELTVTGVGVAADLPALRTLRVVGALADADVSVDGSIGLVHVGAIRNSRLFAGYTGADDGTGTFIRPATVGTFRVSDAAWGFENSTVIASRFKAVSVTSLVADNGDAKFGFRADEGIGLLKVLDPLFVYNPADLSSQGVDDFEVRIV